MRWIIARWWWGIKLPTMRHIAALERSPPQWMLVWIWNIVRMNHFSIVRMVWFVLFRIIIITLIVIVLIVEPLSRLFLIKAFFTTAIFVLFSKFLSFFVALLFLFCLFFRC